jgi:hypothetical protein
MLFRQDALDAIVRGDVDLAFRRWTSPRVRVGTRLHTAIGLIEVTDLAQVRPDGIGERDARRAGFATVDALMAMLGTAPGRTIYRVTVRFVGADPRVALRQDAELSEAVLAGIFQKLARMDDAAEAPWTSATLTLIGERPAVLAAKLALAMGLETARFKQRVRRLKALGLTESLEVGYRLSPRGRALLLASAKWEVGSGV